MRYYKQTTASHPLSIRFPQFLENINTIIHNEGGTSQPFSDEVALNLDKVKKNSEVIHIKKMKSMDMVLGMNDANNTLSSLLVELKLRCKGTKGLKDGDCKDKIKHSKILLFGSGIPVHNRYVFIFNDNLLQESQSVICRVINNPSVDVLSINELRTNYF